MRIAFVLEEARIDGTIRFFARQVRRLQVRGHDVVVVCAPGVLQGEFETAHLTLIDGLSPQSRPVNAADEERLGTACAGVDLVVAVAGRAFPAAIAGARGARVLLDLLSNDLFVGDGPEITAAMCEAARAGNVVAHTLIDARAHAERYGFSANDVRFVALPVERIDADLPLDRALFAQPDERIVLSAARLDDDHAGYFAPLFDAISILRERKYPVRLVVVGGGKYAERLAAIAPPAVAFLGFRSDLDSLYSLADVYVGEGSSRLEAALAGVPVISSCAQEFPSLCDRALFLFGMQHGTLHAYPPSTAIPQTPFADAIALLLDDASLAKRAAERGRRRVETEHARDVYVSFLERCAAGENLPRGTPGLIPPERVANVRSEPEAIIRAVRSAYTGRNAGIALEEELTWRSYADLPEDIWDGLADATRRVALSAGQPLG